MVKYYMKMIIMNDKYLNDYLKENGDLPLLNYAKVGERILPFKTKVLTKDNKIEDWDIVDNFKAKKWTVINFYPADFTFICPTEIQALNQLKAEFDKVNAEVLVASVDNIYSHLGWKNAGLGQIEIPMLSDETHVISKFFGAYIEKEGLTNRTTLIISPQGVLYVNYTTSTNVGRDANEVLRLLQASQFANEGKLVPCAWKPGKDFLKI